MKSQPGSYRTSLRLLAGRPLLVLMLAACAVKGFTYWRSAEAQTIVPPGAHRSGIDINERTLQLCRRLGNRIHARTEPVYRHRCLDDTEGHHYYLSIWTQYCEMDGRGYQMEWNDNTGNLVRMTPEDASATPKEQPAILTAAAAAAMGMSRLREIQLLPPGARLRLAGTPFLMPYLRVWCVNWTVVPAGNDAPYDLLLQLDDHDGKPIRIVNHKEQRVLGANGERELKGLSLYDK